LTELVSVKVLPYAACGAGLGWLLGYALGAFAFELDARGGTAADGATGRPRRTAELWPWRS
jgi:membrane protein YqaA with SNARE-associated domain